MFVLYDTTDVNKHTIKIQSSTNCIYLKHLPTYFHLSPNIRGQRKRLVKCLSYRIQPLLCSLIEV